ncbi:hypothetical protein M378DRAFT_27403 [Amanita muscaria Koide BX008]|uniref:Uncharacterized protein n=1 Tax=Amanita muscaria (strain Koide BX008) TaxID=946122 RepID=A0A0C2WPS3_AMAMK|nr:hypothetical protein M378DRAFT_27403 [Amanita muscaria Koide BX008]
MSSSNDPPLEEPPDRGRASSRSSQRYDPLDRDPPLMRKIVLRRNSSLPSR